MFYALYNGKAAYRKLLSFTGAAFVVFFSLTGTALAQQIQITGAQDLSFGVWNYGSGDVNLTQGICVYKDSGSTAWAATGVGDAPGGVFELTDGNGHYLPYTVQIDSTNLTANTLSTALHTANLTAADCGGSTSDTVKINIASGDMSAAPTGYYYGTISLTATPQ